MRQIIYVSRATGNGGADVHRILEQSRHNNALDGVTGLLWSDGLRFMQVLEGPEDSVGPVFDRISADPRHRDVEVLLDRSVDGREFGYWSMHFRDRHDRPDELSERVRYRLANASAEVREAFGSLLEAGPA